MAPRRRLLLATNLTLAAGIAIAAVSLPANGTQQPNRARGQYTMLAGDVRSGGNASVVYLIDSVNEEMIAVRWDDNQNALQGIDYRSLAKDAEPRQGR
ncbi:MAG: hypothetical protein Q9O74_08780 [Planctomycetota bacterium]|nr:hypothetical protein [Planctomycetota bacterium]